MVKLPNSVEVVRNSVLAWIEASAAAAYDIANADALETYRHYREWTLRNAHGHATAPYFCQIVHEMIGAGAMQNTRALYQREVD